MTGSLFEYVSDFAEDIKSLKVLSASVIFTLSKMKKKKKAVKRD